MTSKKIKAFTLVELIIVIAIIAILAVTAFLVLTKWIAKSRDSARLSDLNTIQNALQISLTENNSLPKPDNYTLIYASGTTNVVGYQGEFSDNTAKALGNLSKAPKDSLDNIYYTYYVNSDASQYQLLGYTENSVSYNQSTVNAVDYSSRYIRTAGDALGVLTDSNNAPVNKLGLTGIDIAATNSTYVAHFNDKNNVAGTGKDLLTVLVINNKNLSNLDTGLVFYSDMESTFTSGGMNMLKDFSIYGNNGYLTGTTLPQISNGIKGKALYFTGGGYIDIPNSDSLNIYNSSVTRIARIKQDVSNGQSIIFNKGGNYNLRLDYKDGFIRSADTLGHGLSSTYSFNLGQGYFIAGVYDKDTNTVRNYVNGVKIQEDSVDGGGRTAVSSTSHLLIQGGSFYGVIDEARVYNHALSDNEIEALYNATK